VVVVGQLPAIETVGGRCSGRSIRINDRPMILSASRRRAFRHVAWLELSICSCRPPPSARAELVQPHRAVWRLSRFACSGRRRWPMRRGR
jgi:hypothetical protein